MTVEGELTMLNDLRFEIIETCPNNCLFCSSCSSINKTRMIDYNKFKEVIDYFISIGGIKEISISGGEPLLHPELLRMIRYCKLNNIKTRTLFSNPLVILDKTKQKYALLLSKLDALSPLKTLERGYGIIKLNEKAVTSIKDLKKDDLINIELKDGSKEAIIK